MGVQVPPSVQTQQATTNLSALKVIQEKIDSLNSVISIELGPEDYQTAWSKSVKDYAKKTNLKGFRPGNAPLGVVKKMYGQAILFEELQQLLSKNLREYILENKINILGEPIPKKKETLNLDPDANEVYSFEFELGLAPEFEVDLSKVSLPIRYVISIDDASIEKEVNHLREKYSKFNEFEVIESEENMAIMNMDQEGPENGMPKNFSRATRVGKFPSKDLVSKVIGLKKGDSLSNVLAGDLFVEGPEIERVLKEALGVESVSEQQIQLFAKTSYSISPTRIVKMVPAEENEELYNQIFPGREVKTPEAFRQNLKEDMERFYEDDAQLLHRSSLQKELLSAHPLTLPDDFLKKWLKESSEKITDETLEKEYVDFAKGTHWQLIISKLRDKNTDLNLTREELNHAIENRAAAYYLREGHTPSPEEIKAVADNIKQNKELVSRIVKEESESKALKWTQSQVTAPEKSVSLTEYLELNQPIES